MYMLMCAINDAPVLSVTKLENNFNSIFLKL